MTTLFKSLLVAAPNGGGLFAVHDGEVRLLDARPTTGLSFAEGTLIRAIQAGQMVVYREGGQSAYEWSQLGLDDVHDVLVRGDRVYVVSTGTNEVVEFDLNFRERSRRRFSEAPDSWHLNCLGVSPEGRFYFSAFGCFGTTRGYKGVDSGTGFIRDLRNDEVLIGGLTQPHNLLFEDSGQYLFADSGSKSICRARAGGAVMRRNVDGYPRGLAVHADVLYVGLSCSRNVVLGQSDIRSATLLALRRDTLDEIGRVALPANEIYDVQHVESVREFERLCRAIAGDGAR